jgi:hypothetical protein
VWAGRVAPSAVVAGQRVVGRAQVGGGDGDGRAGFARAGPAAVARDGVALPARRAVVEQHRAQRRVVDAVALRVQVAVPARAACMYADYRAVLLRSSEGGSSLGTRWSKYNVPIVPEPSLPP